jgi:DNA-binding beta-propeller fold protein YncE
VRARSVVLGSCLVATLLAGPAAMAGPPSPASLIHTYTVPGAFFLPVAVDSRSHTAYIGSDSSAINDTEVINTRTGAAVTKTVPSFSSSIAIDQASGLAYVPDYVAGDVTVMKGSSVVKKIHLATGALPFAATIDPVTGLVYIDDDHIYSNSKCRVWVLKGEKVVTSINVGTDPSSGAVDPTDGDVYILQPSQDTVTIIRGTKVINTVDVNSNPTTIEPKAVDVDPTRHLAYVVDQGGFSILHGAKLQTTVTDGDTLADPYSIVVDPANHYAYIGTAFNDDSVTILDGAHVKTTVAIGELPGTPVYDPANGLVTFPSELAPQISVFRGLHVVKSVSLTVNPVQAGAVGVDTSDGRLYASGFHQDLIAELQTPAPGAITVTRPTHGRYPKGAKVHVKFACTAGRDNNVTSCTGSSANGHLLATSTLGTHHFTVKLRAAYGPTITKSVTYTVRK